MITSNDPRVRAYAVQKTMAAIDLGVQLGAETYVFWGGREGAEVEAAKDPVEALQWMREAMNFLIGREVYRHLERVLDGFEDVADEIQGIVIDHA